MNRSILCKAAPGIALAACALAAGCQRAEEAPPEPIRPVRVITIEPRRAGDTVSLTGTVQPQTEVNYSLWSQSQSLRRPSLKPVTAAGQ